MFSRTLLRTFLRAAPTKPILKPPRPSLHHLPRAPPPILPRQQPFSQTSAFRQSYRPPPPPRRFWPHENPEYVRHRIRTAKPLVTTEQLKHIAKSARTRWVLIIAAGGFAVFYVSNLEDVPVSGRRRFNCFSEESVEAEGRQLYRALMRQVQNSILPSWDPRTRQVERVMKRLIPASGLEHVDWEVHVIASDDANAFVIPGGKVFVFTGILSIAQNDDGLAAILGHEIAHNLARHAAESLSRSFLLTPLRWALIYLDAAGITLGAGWLGSVALELGITRRASRAQESEADYIGLMMMARSCYNPKEAPRLWQRMEEYQKQGQEIPEWLSTHPSSKNRAGQMEKWLQQAEDARTESGCASTIEYSKAFMPAVENFAGFFR